MELLYVHFYVIAKLMLVLTAHLYSNALGYCWLSLCTLVRLCCLSQTGKMRFPNSNPKT